MVKQMRQAQREYFAHRDGWTLRRARALEGEVDREILRVLDIVQAREQTAAHPFTDDAPTPPRQGSEGGDPQELEPLVVTMVPPDSRISP